MQRINEKWLRVSRNKCASHLVVKIHSCAVHECICLLSSSLDLVSNLKYATYFCFKYQVFNSDMTRLYLQAAAVVDSKHIFFISEEEMYPSPVLKSNFEILYHFDRFSTTLSFYIATAQSTAVLFQCFNTLKSHIFNSFNVMYTFFLINSIYCSEMCHSELYFYLSWLVASLSTLLYRCFHLSTKNENLPPLL